MEGSGHVALQSYDIIALLLHLRSQSVLAPDRNVRFSAH